MNANKLNSKITRAMYGSQTSYSAIQMAWSSYVQPTRDPETGITKQPHIDPEHIIIYMAAIGRDWRKAFTPPTNTLALENGAFCNWRLWWALYAIHASSTDKNIPDNHLLEPFNGTISVDLLNKIRSIIPQYNFRRDRLNHINPVEGSAYILPEPVSQTNVA